MTRGYDLAGNLTGVINAVSTWSYGYNKRNLLESEQAQIDGKTLLLDPVYNAMAQVASLATPSRTVSFTPDAFGRVRQLGTYITNIQYHPNSLPSSYSLGNLLTYTQTLNNRLWPQTQETRFGAAPPVQKYVYTYSNAGDLTFLDDQADGADDATLGYDHLHRLTSATGLWGSFGYTYDPLHNIRTRTGPSALTYSYDASNRLSGITGAQTRTYGYNAKGEITGDGIKTFVVNPDGQITSITGVASYAYDGNGKRIRVTPQSGSIEYALYSLAGDLLYTEKGSEQTDYLKLAGQTLVELRKTGGATTPVYLHPDLLGSPRKATGVGGTLLWQEHYDPYGAKLNGVAEKIGYTGHAYDGESGYTYMQARFYDPLVGRFLSTDPIHFQDSNPFTFNRYAYANNNPYRYTDPTGMQSCGTGTHIKDASAINCVVASGSSSSSADASTGTDKARSAPAATRDPVQTSQGGSLNSTIAFEHYRSGEGTPLRMSFDEIDTSRVLPSQFKLVREELSRGARDAVLSIDDRLAFSTSGDQALFLRDITLRLQGELSMREGGTFNFTGTLKSFDDFYDFNRANRGLIGEFLTGIGRRTPGTPYWIEIRGAKPITESGRVP